MSWKNNLGSFGEVVAATAAMVTIAFFLWGFYLGLKMVSDLGGFWATLAGGLFYPFVFFLMPWYAGFVLGDWFPLWINYVAFWAAAFTAAGGALLRAKMAAPQSLRPAAAGDPSEGLSVPGNGAAQSPRGRRPPC